MQKNNELVNFNLEKIFGPSNMFKNEIKNSKINQNDMYSINLNVLEFYGTKIDDNLINIIIQHNINTIKIHNQLSHSIDNLPNNINILILYKSDSSQLLDLPNSITHLYFVNLIGELNCLSNGVKVIDFGNYFNSELKYLTITTEEIILGNEFNK